jgi:deazaflavin-dependent oxidoreductase (nitroreductase family)
MGPGRQLLLITKGRRTGEPREVGLTYVEDDNRLVVIASNAGEDQQPSWWLNLIADPRAEVMVGGETLEVVASELEEPERSRLVDRFLTEVDESYAEYQRRTDRRLPVVALTRR